MARPSVSIDSGDSREVERIPVDVPTGRKQMLVGLDQAGVESTAEDRPVTPHTVVDVPRVHRAEPLHSLGQATVWTPQEQMEVIGHQAIGQHHDAESRVQIGEAAAELDAVLICEKDGLTVDPTIHDVVTTILDVDARRTWHAAIMARGCHISMSRELYQFSR
jgi:hypothetical protein